MNTTNRRRYDMLVRVRVFCAEHRDIFAGSPLAAGMLATINASVTEIGGFFATQSSGRSAAHEGAISRREARAALRQSLSTIRRAGRFLALDTPGFDGRFPPARNGSDRALIADATAVALDATPFKDALVAHGLPANVLADLPARIQAVEEAILRQSAGKELHVGARAAEIAALDAATNAAEALDCWFLNLPNLDHETRAIWKNARRIGPTRVRPTAAGEPGPTPGQPSASAQESPTPSKAA